MIEPTIRLIRTDDLDPDGIASLRALFDAAWSNKDGAFSEDDWTSASGGTHVVASIGDRIVSHASVVERVLARVWQGMGFIALHSSHYSKPFMRLMGTSCSIIWREAGEKERLWVCNPAHPIARGIDRYFEIENVEMYGEPFAVPTPDEIVFISWFEGGEVFRSGCTWKRGNGKIFYFRPGHEAYPIYYNKDVRLVLRNAVRWAASDGTKWIDSCPQISAKNAPEPLEIKGPKIHKEDEAGFR